jgi:hypothetical protein
MRNLLLSAVIGLAGLLVGGPLAAVIAVAVVAPAARAATATG